MGTVLEERAFTREDNYLHYWLAGPSAAPLIVFTHGAAMDHRMFAAQIPAVTLQYRMLMWDVPGHGQSPSWNGRFSIRAVVEDLVVLLDELGYDQAILVGHSMGAYISQEFLYQYPDRVAALVTIGSTCLTLKHPVIIRWGMRLSPLALSLYPYRWFVSQAAWGITVTSSARAYVREVVGQHSKQAFNAIWGAVMNCIHPDPAYRISQPVLVTYGQFDYLGLGVIQQQARAWVARDRNCKSVAIPHAAHNAHQENPAFFNKILLHFLQEIG
jgi:3-oxoadipate enol-lactonase